MTKKIMNIKNVLRIIISLLVIFSMTKSCAKALTYDDIKEYVNNTADYYSSNSNYQRIKNGFNNSTILKTKMEDNTVPINNYNNILMYISGPSGPSQTYTIQFEIYNVTEWHPDGNAIRYNGKYRLFSYDIGSSSVNSVSSEYTSNYNSHTLSYCYSTSTNYYNSLKGMNLTAERIEDTYSVPNTYVGLQAMPQWTYLEYVNAIQENTHNGSLFTYYYQGNLYSQAQLKIGNIHPYDSYYYEINLINNSNNIKIGQCFVSENPYNPYSTGALYIDEHHDLYVNTINVDYSTQYRLEVTSYYGDGGDNLFEDIDWYIFLPTNAIISGDSILIFGSGDYTTKDNTIAVTGAIQEQTDTFIDLINESGDDSLVSLPSYIISGDSTENFFVFIIDNIEDAFLSSGDEEIIIPILGEDHEVSSADFNVMPSALVPFFTLFHWGWVGLMIMKDIRKMFENLKNGEFEKIASDDINANLV